MSETEIHGNIFYNGQPKVTEPEHPSPWPVTLHFGTLGVHLSEEQAASLESQLVHVLAGIRTDALVQS